jgi:dTDP-4-dehydrorhamnose 3,5-epimerase
MEAAMQFTETKLKGAFIIELEPRTDDRGFFARAFCQKEFEALGLKSTIAQCNLAFTAKQGTIRGMHYQVPPAAETKVFRCTKGANYHVIIDMRPESPTYLQHVGVELTSENRRALYVPEMFAHGYQSLVDGSEAFYQVGEFYTPGYERGLRYDDPTFAIEWPLPVSVISEKDASWSLFEAATTGVNS